MKRRILPLVLICAMLLAVLPVSAAAAEPVGGFTDVSTDDYYATAVLWALSWGVTKGTSDTTFSPELICTRAQVLTFLWRAHGEPEPKTSYNPFADVPRGSYYDRATLWAVEEGIAKGTSEDPMLFSPDKPCSKAEILTFIWRAKGSPAPSHPSALTRDWDDSAYYKEAVTWADNEAMLEDEGVVFDPDCPCTRGHTMAWLWREAQVYVSDAEGLMNAIGPGREIHLHSGDYDLTKWLATKDYDTLNAFVKFDMVHDGYEIVIHDVRNLVITADEDVELVVEPRYANVLTFEDCDKIMLSGLTMGHTPEKGFCTGGVLCFRDCGRVAMSGMDLYGCGTYGIIGERVDSIQTVDSVIHDCSCGLVYFQQVKDAGFGDVTFRDSSGYGMLELWQSAAAFQSCTFQNNKWAQPSAHFLEVDNLSAAVFRACTFDQASFDDLTDGRLEGYSLTLEAPTVA